jgi:hypothetical protein
LAETFITMSVNGALAPMLDHGQVRLATHGG